MKYKNKDQKKKVNYDPWVNCFHHKREKEKKEGKEEGWRERKIEILFWFSSFINHYIYRFLKYIFFFFFFCEIILISFRCSFSTWVYLVCCMWIITFFLLFFLFSFLGERLAGFFNLLYVVMFKLLCCC